MGEWSTKIAEDIFNHKYRHTNAETWEQLARTLVSDVTTVNKERLIPKHLSDFIYELIRQKIFIPGGRYLYYAGRKRKFFNNCFAFRVADTREGWADFLYKATSALMAGGGIGADYSQVRPAGTRLRSTGGLASGPIPLMLCANEIGRQVRQGGSRRSAIWAGLLWSHMDIYNFIHAKDWPKEVRQLKAKNYDFPAPLDMTNISVILDTEFFEVLDTDITANDVFHKTLRQMFKTGEPGFSCNFLNDEESLRNACTEVTAVDDSTACNLGSVNLAKFGTGQDACDFMYNVAYAAVHFLYCGTITSELPFPKAYLVRKDNRDIGLGLMGLTAWCMLNGLPYAPTDELRELLKAWAQGAEEGAKDVSDRLGRAMPRKTRAVAPTGTISILASTSSGIEPLYALAVKRRYLSGERWRYQYVVDPTAEWLMHECGYAPEKVESEYTAFSIPFEQRLKMQALIQEYTDMGISSTINVPEWGSAQNNDDTLEEYEKTLRRYLKHLRGVTIYPNKARDGQPIEAVSYREAKKFEGIEYTDLMEQQCPSGVCGI